MMVIEGGGGSNTINVTASSDPLVLYGNDSGDGSSSGPNSSPNGSDAAAASNTAACRAS